MCPKELVAGITALAVTITEGRSADENALLGTIFTQIGDTITTISVQQAACENKK